MELVDDLGRRASMPGPLQRADRAGHRRGHVRVGADDHPRGEGRGVEAVLGADDEVRVERPRRRFIRPLAAQLVQEAGCQPQRRVRLDRLVALAQARERRQRGRRDGGDRPRLLDRRRPQRRRSPRPTPRWRCAGRPWRPCPAAACAEPRAPRRGSGAQARLRIGPATRRSTAARRPARRCRARRARRSG